MPRGGRRKGAGRPKGTGKFGEPTKAVRLPISMIDHIMRFIDRKGLTYPLHAARVRAGESEPASKENLDLMDHLIPNAGTAFFTRASGDAMNGAGILAGDLLIVDRGAAPRSGNIVVAVVGNECVVRRYVVKNRKIELKPENSKFSSTHISSESELNVLGVVKHVIHSF